MSHWYHTITSLNNLCQAWQEFVRGKKFKPDVAEFSLRLSQNIFSLYQDLQTHTYRHGSYKAFSITDPKPRSIHKAIVRDRLLHHAVHRILHIHFEPIFIYDSYSCRNSKGTHRALNRFRYFYRKVSKNNNRTVWILKCDIKKFFASINHQILLSILKDKINDEQLLGLLREIVGSFSSGQAGVGLPLGNLTSQLLVNVYMNEFDQFVKHQLRLKYYLRYADDFVVLHQDKQFLQNLIPVFEEFLREKLKLTLHPDKVFIKTLASGVDFLGWVHFPDHRVLRTATKRRMVRALLNNPSEATTNSYLGLLKHGNTHTLTARIIT